MNWIRVKDRLPDALTAVIIHYDGIVSVGEYYMTGGEGGGYAVWTDLLHYDGPETHLTTTRVDRWLPLPRPPEVEG
jgi:hypothetical protein